MGFYPRLSDQPAVRALGRRLPPAVRPAGRPPALAARPAAHDRAAVPLGRERRDRPHVVRRGDVEHAAVRRAVPARGHRRGAAHHLHGGGLVRHQRAARVQAVQDRRRRHGRASRSRPARRSCSASGCARISRARSRGTRSAAPRSRSSASTSTSGSTSAPGRAASRASSHDVGEDVVTRAARRRRRGRRSNSADAWASGVDHRRRAAGGPVGPARPAGRGAPVGRAAEPDDHGVRRATSRTTDRIDAADVTLGGEPVAPAPEWLDDWFAPAQFDRLDDTSRLSSPSYELMTAGVRFGDAGVGDQRRPRPRVHDGQPRAGGVGLPRRRREALEATSARPARPPRRRCAAPCGA